MGSTIELVDSILRNDVQNGMAIIRPPGHHAMKAEYNGYCFFNNVAIAAQHALDNRDVSKELISKTTPKCHKIQKSIFIRWFFFLLLKTDKSHSDC